MERIWHGPSHRAMKAVRSGRGQHVFYQSNALLAALLLLLLLDNSTVSKKYRLAALVAACVGKVIDSIVVD